MDITNLSRQAFKLNTVNNSDPSSPSRRPATSEIRDRKNSETSERSQADEQVNERRKIEDQERREIGIA